MPGATNTEKLYGPPGPQNSAVLMDIITKLKHDLHQSRAENGKLVDQLNCLISLVKRAWGGEQGAVLHLANIVGMEPPNYSESDVNRNTPIPEKTRAVRNWERITLRLLEREYRAIQQEIQEKQRLYLQNRQMFMNDVMEDHNREMSRVGTLHKNSEINEVDKKFLRCFSAKTRKEKKSPQAYRPHSAYKAPPRTAGDMVDKVDMRVGDIIGQQAGPTAPDTMGTATANKAFSGLYKMGSQERLLYRPKEKFDDPSRYRQTKLFDPDVIFSPEMLSNPRETKERPLSAKSAFHYTDPKTGARTRPKSAVFLTEGRPGPERPLRYETTRPVSGKPRPASKTNLRQRRHSASNADQKPPAPAHINRKELHNRSQLGTSHSQYEIHSQAGYQDQNGSGDHVDEPMEMEDAGHMTSDEEVEEVVLPPRMKTPIAVSIRRNDPVDKFVDDLKLMQEMEHQFKNSHISLQKKIGIDSNGFVF